jgi:hypothetical protein
MSLDVGNREYLQKSEQKTFRGSTPKMVAGALISQSMVAGVTQSQGGPMSHLNGIWRERTGKPLDRTRSLCNKKWRNCVNRFGHYNRDKEPELGRDKEPELEQDKEPELVGC